MDVAVTYRPGSTGRPPDLLYYGDAPLVSAARAGQDLGFTPIVEPARAMALTRAWAESARLVPASSEVHEAVEC